MRDLLLVGAVVIHHPDFFVAAALADEVDLGFGDAGYASAEAEDDFVGKPVGDHAHGVAGCVVGVLLAEHLRRLLILDVVKPSLHRDFAGGRAQVAEGEHGGIGRRRIPRREVDFGWLPGYLQRIETLRNKIEDSGVVEIVPEHVVESLQQFGVLGVAGRGLEVGGGQAHSLDAEPGAGADPVLRGAGGREQSNHDTGNERWQSG